MPIERHNCDVVIVGARAAGAATALLLARLGHSVLVLERAVFPADTLSTHLIARTGVVQLHRWGLLPAALESGAPPIRQVCFSTPKASITRQITHASGVDLLVAPRRYILDDIVAKAAADAGADVRFGVTVAGLHRDDTGRVTGVYGHDGDGNPVDVQAQFVIGADGLGSGVARAVGAEISSYGGNGGAVQYAYYDGIPWSGIELIATDRALTGVFPTHHGQACIWICSPSTDARDARRMAASREEAFTNYLARTAPRLAHRLRAGRRRTAVRGMLRTPNYIRRSQGPGWALVGDAGYHRDTVTGHGISDAYRDAELLAAALHRSLLGEVDEVSALTGYQRQRDVALRAIFGLTCEMASYPPVPEFARLHKRLTLAIDDQAAVAAAWPMLGDRRLVTTDEIQPGANSRVAATIAFASST